MLKIKHKTLQASINPAGAELSSLLNDGSELIWHGDETIWGSRAPILFPIVGSLKDGKTTYKGKTYELERHGFARKATFECIDHLNEKITMRLKADATTLLAYPWLFELQVCFEVSDSGLEISYTVFNLDKTDMLFTLGSHPAFALKIDSDHRFEDYAIEFNKAESLATYALTDDGLLSLESKPFNTNKYQFALSKTIFDQDALVFRDVQSNRISLRCKDKTLLSVHTGGAPHLGIWSKPAASYVCIEPWLGTSDFVNSNGELASKPDMLTLSPGDRFSHSISVVPG